MPALDLTPDPNYRGLAPLLEEATSDLQQMSQDTPVLVRLAVAFNGFFIIRVVSILLSEHAIPARDAYPLAVDWTTQALELIDSDYLMTKLIRRHCPLRVGGEAAAAKLATAGQMELHHSTDTDIANISDRVVILSADLEQLLSRISRDDSSLPEPRSCAQSTARLAHEIWAHYGGDGGGW